GHRPHLSTFQTENPVPPKRNGGCFFCSSAALSAVAVEDLEDIVEGIVFRGSGGRLLTGSGLLGRLGHGLLLRSGGKGLVGHGALQLLKAGSNNGNPDLVLQGVVEGGTEDDEGVGMGGLLHQVGSGL